MRRATLLTGCAICLAIVLYAAPSSGLKASVIVNTGVPDGQVGMASRPGPAICVNQDTESADDFVLTSPTRLTSGTFVGLLPICQPLNGVSQVRVEIYRIFPDDSNAGRTPDVPTRNMSPADVQFADRDSASSTLSFTASQMDSHFMVSNTVDIGIFPLPRQRTHGQGPTVGKEVQFNVTFTTPLDLPAGHYFFVPQVLLSNAYQHFLWLSAARPISAPGIPFSPDLETWIRNEQLSPDWLRVGTDVIGKGAFNAVFSLSGDVIPEPASPDVIPEPVPPDSDVIPEPASLLIWGFMAALLAGLSGRRRTVLGT